MEIRDATVEDARELAYLINLAGEGIPEYLWQDQAGAGETPLDVGARRASRTEGGFSYRHARVCVEDGRILGMVLAYRLPDPYTIDDLDDYPSLVRPLLRLESRAPGSWYLNGIATLEQCRGRGVARGLMEDAIRRARENGCDRVSLIVSSENTRALRLYRFLGFEARDRLPVVPYPGARHGGDWVLMTRTC